MRISTYLLAFGIATFAALLSFTPNASAQTQVVMDSTNHPLVSFTDSLVVAANPANIAAPARGANRVWNYGAMQTAVSASTYFNSFVACDAAHPASTFAGADAYGAVEFGAPIALNRVYVYTPYYETGKFLGEIGRKVSYQPYSISFATGNVADSITFHSQFVPTEGGKDYIMKYPVAYGNVWNEQYRRLVTFNLTVTAYGLNHLPGDKRTYTTSVDSVIGWGKLIVPALVGGAGLPVDALLIKNMTTAVDSFYLGGAPASSAVLSAFSLTQGAVHKITSYHFVRPFLLGNAMTMTVNNSNVPTTVFWATKGITTSTTNEALAAAARQILLFPNPTDGNELHILWSERPTDAILHYEITDLLGRSVASGNYTTDGSTLTLPSSVVAGQYALTLRTTDGQLLAAKRFVKE